MIITDTRGDEAKVGVRAEGVGKLVTLDFDHLDEGVEVTYMMYTPTQARELAKALIEAAYQAEEFK